MHRRILALALLLVVAGTATAKSVNWASRTGMPAGADGLAAVDVSGTLFVFGGGSTGDGSTMSTTVRAYTRTTDTWTTRTNMPTARVFHAAVAIGSTVYIIGGHVSLDGAGGALGSTTFCHAYNTKTDTWTLIAPMAVPREASGAAASGGKV